jgi:hypothetical protein
MRKVPTQKRNFHEVAYINESYVGFSRTHPRFGTMPENNNSITPLKWTDVAAENAIKFIRGDTGTYGHYQRPLQICSPPMNTMFPKLTLEQMSSSTIQLKSPELDITMKGAGPTQEAFRVWMDRVDNLLLDHMFHNQQELGKVGLTKDQVAMMQKRCFRSRISTKTGKTYSDAMACRQRNVAWSDGNGGVPVYDVEGQPHAIELRMNDTVSVCLSYQGCYIRSGQYFGNVWNLVCVMYIESAPGFDCEIAPPSPGSIKKLYSDVNMTDVPMT